MAQAAWLQGSRDGRFRRKASEFRSWITTDGSSGFPAAAGRYHLYVQYACPWAHRTLIARTLLGLEDVITVDVVDWHMQPDGSWAFDPEEPGCTADSVHGHASLQDVYREADPEFPGIGTVPVLFDKQGGTIVNNESREILRMLDSAFDGIAKRPRRLLPEGLEDDVDKMIDANYEPVNNGVYKAGFARTQAAYDEAVAALFGRLDELDAHLRDRDWLVGPGRGVLTEADVCLFTTLLRFDPVYHTHFKCNRTMIHEMPALWAFVRRMAGLPGVAETIDMRHIKGHYYWSHTGLNPNQIVPVGPRLDL